MKQSLLILILICAACSVKDKYDVARYHKGTEADSVLTSIIAYVYSPPVYTLMADRFEAEHRLYYASLLPKFRLIKYFVTNDGTHYFYLIRPAAKVGDWRATGGHFKMTDPAHLTNFREEFVTPILPEEDLRNRTGFLFDEMVKGNLDQYLGMRMYVQWPNESSEYDTTTYEWKQKPGL